MPTVTIDTVHADWHQTASFAASYTPSSYPSLGTTLSEDGATELFLSLIDMPNNAGGGNSFTLRLSATTSEAPHQTGPDFSTAFETSGTITFTLGNNTLVLDGIPDSTEPYAWTPSNLAEVNAFGTAVHNSNNRAVSITFDLPDTITLAAIADQTATRGTSYTQVLPEVVGGSGAAVTYAITADNWRGLTPNNASRTISGTPTSAGVINVTYVATSADSPAQTATETFAITVAEPLVAPNFSVSTGASQTWTTGTGITSITVPAATGNPTPTYAQVGGLPTGISFDASTRVISGTPTVAGTGTIRIRATNSQGTDDWTVAYTISNPANTAPFFSDNTGTAQTWNTSAAITSITVPTASGFPVPTYAQVGNLPAGIRFNASTRVISGTPTAAGSGTITIRATNTEGSDDWTVAYEIFAPLALPTIASQSAVVNLPFSQTLPEATGGSGGNVYTVSTLPVGLSFNANTLVISGTPTTRQTVTVTYRVTDSSSTSRTRTFSITVGIGAGTASYEFYLDTVALNGGNVVVRIQFLNSGGAVINQSIVETISSDTGGFTRYTGQGVTIPSVAARVRLRFVLNRSGSNASPVIRIHSPRVENGTLSNLSRRIIVGSWIVD